MSDLLTRSEISDMMCDLYAMGTYDAFAIRNGYFEKSMDYVVRSTGVIYKILATFDALMERVKELNEVGNRLEAELQVCIDEIEAVEMENTKVYQRVKELEAQFEHIKRWCAHDNTIFSSTRVAAAVVRMCDE